MITLNRDVMAAVDIETTGLILGFHELIQICILPLDANLEPMDTVPFYRNVRPYFPERASKIAMKVNGLALEELELAKTPEETVDDLSEWFQMLGLPTGGRLVPLTQNAPFDIPRVRYWLGEPEYERMFSRRGVDTMFSARYINDKCAWQNRPLPFSEYGLKSLCNKFGIVLDNHHDALADCIATAKVYRELLQFEY